MYNIQKILSIIFKEYKINEEIFYSKNNKIYFGRIIKIEYNKGEINPCFIVDSNNEKIKLDIENIFLKNNPYLNLNIKQLKLFL